MTTLGTYATDLSRCPKVNVTAREFEERALLAGWDALTVELFLRAPDVDEYVKVGGEALRVRR